MKLLDRVKLTEDYKLMNGIILKSGTIGTCRQIDLDNQDVTLQIPIFSPSFQTYMSTHITITDLIVDNISQSELDNFLNENPINYEYLTSKIFHINNIWSIRTGYNEFGDEIFRSGLIMKYNVELNENNDTLEIKFFDNEETKFYKKRYLDQFGSYSIILD